MWDRKTATRILNTDFKNLLIHKLTIDSCIKDADALYALLDSDDSIAQIIASMADDYDELVSLKLYAAQVVENIFNNLTIRICLDGEILC